MCRVRLRQPTAQLEIKYEPPPLLKIFRLSLWKLWYVNPTRFLEVKSGPPSAQTGGKLRLRMATRGGGQYIRFFPRFFARYFTPIKRDLFSVGQSAQPHEKLREKFLSGLLHLDYRSVQIFSFYCYMNFSKIFKSLKWENQKKFRWPPQSPERGQYIRLRIINKPRVGRRPYWSK
jgi:hypothetical protein